MSTGRPRRQRMKQLITLGLAMRQQLGDDQAQSELDFVHSRRLHERVRRASSAMRKSWRNCKTPYLAAGKRNDLPFGGSSIAIEEPTTAASWHPQSMRIVLTWIVRVPVWIKLLEINVLIIERVEPPR